MGDGDGFYVGYMAVPASYKRVLKVIIGAAAGVIVGSAAAITMSQRDPGAAVWDIASEREFTGVAVVEPFPAVLIANDDGVVLPHLVVQMGKVGARELLEPVQGELVTVRGYQLERAGRRIIELTDGQTISSAGVGDGSLLLSVSTTGERVELEGEILDGKCYLGAMKPGDGKAHKACALLCLDGGLPPMFADTRDPATADIRLLVFGDSGSQLPVEYRGLVAEPVVITGKAATWGDLDVVVVVSVTRR